MKSSSQSPITLGTEGITTRAFGAPCTCASTDHMLLASNDGKSGEPALQPEHVAVA
jgi:hypothetical protein